MTFTHASYTVAWICALPLELAAAKAVLDNLHPTLPQPRSDHNVYTLGSVSGHNVVVACLPAGVYGTTSATAAVSNLMSTYLNVRFGLMVGIGGGVPRGSPDIRLGDIVVSKPTDTSSGVIQYDYGKTLQSGRFHRTGSLNKPPLLLLKVIAQLESDYLLGKTSLNKIMASSLQKEEVQKIFSRPSTDQLFQPTYDHIGDGPNCSACAQSQLVDRPQRVAEEPHIHYGLIASGNQVMKDARTRDLVAQELNILCFEMEAAGLMDMIPSLVIRGICDYCDSHKHKEWQAYAALVAAAYAKAVLGQVPQGQREPVLEKRHWMVPFHRNLGFVGREEEIIQIEEWIKVGQSKIAVCGLGGVGKTQVIIELAYRIRERDSKCSIFWIPCTSYASVEQAYMDIAQILGIQHNKPAEVKEHVKAYLSHTENQKWLLIFDNADDMDMWFGGSSVGTVLTDLLPQSEKGCILFTTRNRKLAVNSLIKQHLLDNKKAAIALLEQLMFLPLAITQAAAYINSNDIELSDYTALLQDQEPEVIELLSESFEDQGRYKETLNPVATTWLLSFYQIQKLNPLAVDYLAFMACISPRDIPQSLLPNNVSRRKRIDALGLLKAFSFINEQAIDHALSLHRLVYLSTRNWLRNQGQFDLHIQKAADHFSQVFPTNNHENQKRWREYLPHALSLLNEECFKTKRKGYMKLIQNIGRCLHTDGRYNEAVTLFEDLVKLQRKNESDYDLSALIAMTDLGSAYRGQGRWNEAEKLQIQGRWNEAEKLGVQVLETRKAVLGARHPSTLASMGNLASTYSNQGRWNEAEKLQVQVMETKKIGRWNEAENLEVQVMETRKTVLGAEHPDTLTSMTNLASTYWNQGRWNEAEKLQVHVMETLKTVLGAEHPDTLASMNNLAHTWHSQEKVHVALALMGECDMLCKKVLGPSHPHSISVSHHLSNWKE
ncbi:hypothetical protein BJX63DRAFT_417851 [Aspergillus granulosus]|uniref:Uncharacterized protein n=1 Tax=Aspergillus granulosus TaxID=176169 RepID=A0ABR4I2W0_9EURO